MRAPVVRIVAPLVAILALLLPTVAWAVDTGDGAVLRGVTLDGEDIAGLSRAEVAERVAALSATFASTPVEIDTGDMTLSTTAGALGITIDQPATVDRVLGVGRRGFFLAQIGSWVRSFVQDRAVPVALKIDPAAVKRTIEALDADPALAPVEPGFVVDNGVLVAKEGREGSRIEPADVLEELRTVRFTTDTIRIAVARTSVPPTYSLEDAQALVARAEQMTAAGLEVAAGRATTTLAPEQLRSWLTGRATPQGLEIAIDAAVATGVLADLLSAGNTEPGEARITVVNGVPQIRGGDPGARCCAPEAAEVILDALERGDRGPVALPMIAVPPQQSAADLEALGIREEVASFTTRHRCCEPRVSNIHKVADMLRGYIIKPGETMSLNKVLGPRTAANGFVAAPAIVDGVLEPQIGGGVSQFMTTIFNAAFFAGLDYGTYQSHSLYISRYPFGREATINWPTPDLEIKNTTPYGVMVWPTYTDTSITVTLYSTRVFAKVEQGTQTTSLSGKSCTAVVTERIRTRLDGSVLRDSVRARYRAQEGLNCGDPLPPGVKPVAAPGQPPPSVPPEFTVPTTAAPTTTAPATTAPPTTPAPATTVPPTTLPPTTTVPAGG